MLALEIIEGSIFAWMLIGFVPTLIDSIRMLKAGEYESGMLIVGTFCGPLYLWFRRKRR